MSLLRVSRKGRSATARRGGQAAVLQVDRASGHARSFSAVPGLPGLKGICFGSDGQLVLVAEPNIVRGLARRPF